MTYSPFGDHSVPESATLPGPVVVMPAHVFDRGKMPQRTVRSAVIVVETPGAEKLLSVIEGMELIHVQALVAQTSVKAFDVTVFRGFARMRSQPPPNGM